MTVYHLKKSDVRVWYIVQSIKHYAVLSNGLMDGFYDILST